MAKIYIGIGHGGTDSGACASGYRESDLALGIGKACYDYLISHGIEAKMSRTVDKDVTIEKKCAESDAYGADYCLDIHINAGGGNGAEVYHHHLGGNSKKLAQCVLDSLVGIGAPSRGLKVKMNSSGTADYFGIIRNTDASAILVECGFIDTPKDLERFRTADGQRRYGEAIAKGIIKQLGGTPSDDRFTARTWKNGSTVEWVYPDTRACYANKWAWGRLDPYDTATVRERYKACPCVTYPASDGSTRVGFVQWEGGVEAKDYKTVNWTNGSTPEQCFSTTKECREKRDHFDTLAPYSRASCIGIVDGCYAIVWALDGGDFRCGFVEYSGGVE